MPISPRNTTILAAAALVLAAGAAPAADAVRGRLLYENHCMACHASVVHIREQRRASTPGELRAQITRWSTHLELPWHAAEQADVADYLDQRYYRFPASVPAP